MTRLQRRFPRRLARASILFLALSLLAATAPHSRAQVNVRKPAGASVAVSLAGVQTANSPAAQLVRRTLELNLQRSGWMRMTPNDQAQVFVGGSITETGGQVTFSCVVTNLAGGTYLSAAYPQPAAHALHAAHRAAHDIVEKVTGKPSYFLGQLVLIGTKGGTKELFLADSSMQSIRQITQNRSISVKPRWSPDNRFISYTSYHMRFPDIYTIELATGRHLREAAYPGVNAGGAISPDGRSMALILSKDGNPDLYVKDRASGRLTRLTHTPRAVEGSPVWSPDGSQIAYVSDATGTPQIYVISRNGGSPTRLTSRGSQSISPDWGANGLIAYQTMLGRQFQIAVLDPATRQDVLVSPPGASFEDPSWAPDGRHIVATRVLNYQNTIYLLDTDGGEPVALSNSGEWSSPAWSR